MPARVDRAEPEDEEADVEKEQDEEDTGEGDDMEGDVCLLADRLPGYSHPELPASLSVDLAASASFPSSKLDTQTQRHGLAVTHTASISSAACDNPRK